MGHHLSLTPAQAREQLLREPFKIRHSMARHPLFRLERLVRLAQSMDRDRIEYNAGSVGIDQRPEDTPSIDLPAAEVIASIESANAWLVIKNVETDPDYRRLLQGSIEDIRRSTGAAAEEMSDVRGFIFIASAHSTTPFHIDGEDNILVHIRGQKRVHVFDNEDRSLVGEAAMEMSPDKHRNQSYRPEFEARAREFELEPGDGVHIPYLWPHWVATGPSHAVSMAITWKSPRVIRLNKIRTVNGLLRRVGLAQQPPGQKPALDAIKVGAFTCGRMALQPLRRFEIARRMIRQVLAGSQANYFYKG
ncbi:hypothetical protein FHS85_003560 [Rhodoligotrophos appendicifer]|uniref:cupin-like domain-containing protein n=1 Tax=Rhodoligotrophos appendicifer TaxID=987056 RepID=UPI001185F63A|nr:cupin-like domain-containing protein [Rhodoligotrophos appendicifer]